MPSNPLDAFLNRPQAPANPQPLPPGAPDKFTNFIDFLMHAAGLPIQTGGDSPGTRSGDVVGAGIPFLGAGRRVFHGTTEAYDAIRPGLGGLFYAAERPEAAAAYTRSKAAGLGGEAAYHGGNVMPLTLDVKNAIDLTPEGLGSLHGDVMTAGDLKKVEPFIPPELSADFKRAKTYWRSNDPEAREKGRQTMVNILVDHLLARNPSALRDAGFDGIHYNAGYGNDVAAWAVQDPNQVINAITKERGVGNLPGKRK